MTTVVRIVIAQVALLAGYYAFRLVIAYAGSPRHHIGSHALWMTCALCITAGLAVARMAVAGDGHLTPWDALIGSQVGFLVAGLRPVWRHHETLSARRAHAQEKS